jgi:hypothetical protein
MARASIFSLRRLCRGRSKYSDKYVGGKSLMGVGHYSRWPIRQSVAQLMQHLLFADCPRQRENPTKRPGVGKAGALTTQTLATDRQMVRRSRLSCSWRIRRVQREFSQNRSRLGYVDPSCTTSSCRAAVSSWVRSCRPSSGSHRSTPPRGCCECRRYRAVESAGPRSQPRRLYIASVGIPVVACPQKTSAPESHRRR